MASDREKLEGATLEQLADCMQDGPQIGRPYHASAAELERRKATWQRKAKQATEDAANAAIETAEHTRRSARYMLWSVVVLALASALNLVVSFAAWRYPVVH
jgi:hypothetical protein